MIKPKVAFLDGRLLSS